MNYEKYSVDDFVSDPSFRNWVLNSDTSFDWQYWLHANPNKQEEAQKAIFLLKATSAVFEHLSYDDARIEAEKIIQKSLKGKTKELNRSIWKYAVGLAAMLVAVGIFWFQNSQKSQLKDIKVISAVLEKGEHSHWITVVNREKQNKLIVLPDGSTLLLKKDGQVSFPSTFSQKHRNIYMYGEAFFEIVKNPHRPFTIYSNSFTTEVLGTSFMLRDFDDRKEAGIIVKTGKVKVSSSAFKNEKNTVKLPLEAELSANDTWTPSKIINIETKNHNTSKPKVLSEKIQTNEFRYRNARLVEVLEDLENTYSIKINLDKKELAEMKLSATLGDEPFFRKLDLIMMALDLDYSLDGDEIYITKPN